MMPTPFPFNYKTALALSINKEAEYLYCSMINNLTTCKLRKIHKENCCNFSHLIQLNIDVELKLQRQVKLFTK